jgi:hypothetical protein
VRYGLTTMCVGLGMGGTVIWENPNFEGSRSAQHESGQVVDERSEETK